MGYSTLEDFLDQNPKLCRIAHKPTGWHVYGAVTQETKHIHEMVTSQKRDAGTSKVRVTKQQCKRGVNATELTLTMNVTLETTEKLRQLRLGTEHRLSLY